MSDPRPINPLLKQALELGPTILFFVLYMWIKDRTFSLAGREYSGFIVATVALIPVLLAAIAALWALTGRLSRIQIVTGVMVVFFGGLTAIFNDATFFKMKTTAVYGLFAALLGLGLLRGQSWLQWVMGDLLPMRAEGWMKLTRRLALMFAGLAAANEFVWRTMAEATWVTVETFAFPVVLFLFLWGQIVLLQRYLIEPEGDGGP
ncbi:MAG: septation protein IspZ [Rubellimicrobium sp.]|nr:septation protein IspZ [Rubellimicrobium sp.]